jgi:hypothetical protein
LVSNVTRLVSCLRRLVDAIASRISGDAEAADSAFACLRSTGICDPLLTSVADFPRTFRMVSAIGPVTC